MKKILTIFTMALVALVSLFTIGGSHVYAEEQEAVGEISSIQASTSTLGLPNTLNYDFTRSSVDTTSDFTLNGIKYTVSDGQITAATAPDNASEIVTIGFLDKIGSLTVNQNVYTNMTFSSYTNVKNIVIERTLPTWFCSTLSNTLSGAENMFIISENTPLLSWKHSSSLKNIVMCAPAINISNMDWWKTNNNFDLTSYPDGVKIVTAETLKWTYGKLVDWYKENTNYTDDVDTNVYLIPDSYFSSTLGINLSTYQAEEYGGAVWVKTINGSQTGYSIAYIDPCVTKIIVDGTHFSRVNSAIGRFSCDLNFVYCKSGASIDACINLDTENLYGPVPTYLTAKQLAGVSNKVYLYKGAREMEITHPNFPQATVVNYTIYLQSGVTVYNNSLHETIGSHIVNGYSETITPCVEIKVNGNTESSTTASTTVAQLKSALNQRLEEEAEAAALAAQEAADRAAALEVDNEIDELPETITLANKPAVQAARASYNALTVTQKSYVTKLNKLSSAEQAIVALEVNASQVAAYRAAANDVDSVILQIPSSITLDDKPKVVAARNAYNALANDAKVYVTKYYKLETAEATISRLEAERDERIAKARQDAGSVDTLITNIPVNVGLADKNQVEEARAAYEELTGEAKGYVTKLQVLENAEREIKKLELASSKTAEELAAIKAKAKEVDDLIAAFPITIALDVQEQVEEARAAYNALSEEEKLYVENLASLEKAEDDLRELGAKLATDPKEDIKEQVKEKFDEIKDRINSSKGLKALTITVSIVLGFGLIYVVYLIIRKTYKWLKR